MVLSQANKVWLKSCSMTPQAYQRGMGLNIESVELELRVQKFKVLQLRQTIKAMRLALAKSKRKV